MRADYLVAGLLVLSLIACAGARGRGPAIGSSSKAADVGGTISGVVRASEGSAPLVGRLVTAIEVTTGAKYESPTASNGGYTMKVPKGRYRLELQLRPGESLAKQPEETQIDTSDMDAGRDFLVASKPPPA
jgi:Carboxypeptidase regulatory-like domain